MTHLKFKFDENKDEQSGQQPDDSQRNENYPGEGNVRNVCFVLEDGKRFFINYAYLVSAECDAENTGIILLFTTHAISLVGINMGSLFLDLMKQLTAQISWSDGRYNHLSGSKSCVNKIEIKENS